MARCESSGRDKVIWKVRSVTWRSRTGSVVQLLAFPLFPLYSTGGVSAGQTDPPSWSLSSAISSVNPVDFLFLSPDEKLWRKPKKKKRGGSVYCQMTGECFWYCLYNFLHFFFQKYFSGLCPDEFLCLFVLFSSCQKRQLPLNLGSIFRKSRIKKKTVKKPNARPHKFLQ